MSNITRFITLVFAITMCISNIALAQSGKNNNQKNVIFLNEHARFPGCEFSALSLEEKVKCSQGKLEAYIRKNLEYPEIAKNPDFAPRIVQIQITVEGNGKVHSPRVLVPDVKEYDRMAQKIILKMVQDGIKWIPGSYNGKAVGSPVAITVHFSWEGRKKAFKNLAHEVDIYEYVDEPPAFITCQQAGFKDKDIRACVQEKMKEFFKHNLSYPKDALELGVQGDIEVEFIVGKDGVLKDIFLKNDLGFGCGEEAIRLVELINEGDYLVWLPGEEDGKRVDVLEKATVEFRIDMDKKMNKKLRQIDAPTVFITEKAGFEKYMLSTLKYPKDEDINPCSQGVIDVKFKIEPLTGNIDILSLTDFNNLGKPFHEEARRFLNDTKGKWSTNLPNLSPATTYALSIPFQSKGLACNNGRKDYIETISKALDAAALVSNKEIQNESLDYLDQAVKNFPADNKLRYLQGMAFFQCNRKVEACVNLTFVKQKNKDIPVPSICD